MWNSVPILSIRIHMNSLILRCKKSCWRGLFACLLSIVYLSAVGCEKQKSKTATYSIEQPLPFLPDKLAFDKARETLLYFYPNGVWEPLTYTQTIAPDASSDRYLQRNRSNSNSGTVHFLERNTRADKIVSVQLHTRQVTCEILISK